MSHIPVLVDEVIHALALREQSVVIDATANGGGHARAIRQRLGKDGLLIACDIDPHAITSLEALAREGGAPMKVIHANFRTIETTIEKNGMKGNVDGILADLGWSTNQFAGGGRGFSFNYDEPLCMTYGNSDEYPFTARDIVNTWNEEDIANVIFGYGEEPRARMIARAICAARTSYSIETSGQLAELIKTIVPKKGRIHPATQTFQALRIAVNDEYTALTDFITGAFASLAHNGRLAIITFHSGEDRIVKNAFRTLAKESSATLITKKPIAPTRVEVLTNPRARSAKLRVVTRTVHHETNTKNRTLSS